MASSQSPKVYAVIMAGGAGTRFWPASRQLRPKQLLPLAAAASKEAEGETLLAATVRRLEPLVPRERVLIVTGEHLADATAKAVPGVPAEQILREPAARNTAPCIAWANATIARIDPDPNAVVMVLPSDHFMTDEPGFRAVLERAIATASTGRVTTVGIVPTRAETGYGYIELGEAIASTSPAKAFVVKRFVEKPDRSKAEAFLASGPDRFLWNAGMFFFRVRDMADLLRRHVPSIADGIAKIDESERAPGATAASKLAVVKEIFPTLESVSIDHGVMEKAESLAVVPGDFGWNDVGSWQSAWELASKDEHGNALGPNDLALEAKNNLVRSGSGKAIALVGVSDLVLVETDDAILVIPRERAQDVRLVIEALKKSNRTDLL